jgi:hypothetical protein
MHCLKSWLERQQSCPTCRRSVLEVRPVVPPPVVHQPGVHHVQQPNEGPNIPPPQGGTHIPPPQWNPYNGNWNNVVPPPVAGFPGVSPLVPLNSGTIAEGMCLMFVTASYGLYYRRTIAEDRWGK